MNAAGHSSIYRLLLMMTAGCLFAGTVLATPTAEDAFLWEQANAAAAVGRTEADCLRAAELYTSLVRDHGVHNGIVFYNMGAILLKGGLYDRAQAATLRAERYLGTTPEIRRNLLLASAHGDAKTEVTLPWYRIPLLWHYGLPYRTRLSLAMASCAFILVLAALWRLHIRRGMETLIVLGSALAIIFTTSVLTTAYQEHRDDRALLTGPLPAQEATPP